MLMFLLHFLTCSWQCIHLGQWQRNTPRRTGRKHLFQSILWHGCISTILYCPPNTWIYRYIFKDYCSSWSRKKNWQQLCIYCWEEINHLSLKCRYWIFSNTNVDPCTDWIFFDRIVNNLTIKIQYNHKNEIESLVICY